MPAERILFGTDVPWGDPNEIATAIVESGVFSASDLKAIERDNALRLLPRYR